MNIDISLSDIKFNWPLGRLKRTAAGQALAKSGGGEPKLHSLQRCDTLNRCCGKFCRAADSPETGVEKRKFAADHSPAFGR